MFALVLSVLWIVLQILACLAAAHRGGATERAAAFGSLAAWGASTLVARPDLSAPQYGTALIDAAMLALLAWLAFRTQQRWLITAAGAQLVSLMIHLRFALDPSAVMPATYLSALQVTYWVTLVSIAIGVFSRWAGKPSLAVEQRVLPKDL
ncbi:hypothetical protein ABOZ73_06400 [Caulobacter sp. 73W]|uniref:Uncharacterized protein n=1 Tax=Caulobacter sp. 73W TaxID=3161137 RepID=A0AB39KXP9_9CAUL